MGGIGARADAGRDGVHDTAASLGRELVEDRFFCRGKRGEAAELRAGTVGDAVEDNKKDFMSSHSCGKVGRAD